MRPTPVNDPRGTCDRLEARNSRQPWTSTASSSVCLVSGLGASGRSGRRRRVVRPNGCVGQRTPNVYTAGVDWRRNRILINAWPLGRFQRRPVTSYHSVTLWIALRSNCRPVMDDTPSCCNVAIWRIRFDLLLHGTSMRYNSHIMQRLKENIISWIAAFNPLKSNFVIWLHFECSAP